jgi:hypothetical protein
MSDAVPSSADPSAGTSSTASDPTASSDGPRRSSTGSLDSTGGGEVKRKGLRLNFDPTAPLPVKQAESKPQEGPTTTATEDAPAETAEGTTEEAPKPKKPFKKSTPDELKDKTEDIKQDLDDAAGVMQENVNRMMIRGEKLDDMETQTGTVALQWACLA